MTTSERTRLLPLADHDTAPYFEGLREHEIRVQRCADCKTVLHLPRPMCFNCHSMNTEWITAGKTAKLYSWTIVTHAVHPSFPVPYVIALVELDSPAGVRLVAGLRNCTPVDLRPDMPLEAVFENLDEESTLLFFRPIR